jgi:hypothetical protein
MRSRSRGDFQVCAKLSKCCTPSDTQPSVPNVIYQSLHSLAMDTPPDTLRVKDDLLKHR